MSSAMSTVDVQPGTGAYYGQTTGPAPEIPVDDMVSKWDQRAKTAERHRSLYEPVWSICQAFLANRQWVAWDYRTSRVVEDPRRSDNRERHTANVITSFAWTIIGKVLNADLSVDVTFRREDVESVKYARQARKAHEYGWEEEAKAPAMIQEAVLSMVTYGTGALAMMPVPFGEPLGEVPFVNGEPLTDPAQAAQYMASAFETGTQVQLGPLREYGLELWPLSPFNMLPPPGVTRREWWPWFIFCVPRALEWLKLRYGDVAANLREERPKTVGIAGARVHSDPTFRWAAQDAVGNLKEHANLYVGYEAPTLESPQGRTCHWSQGVKLFYEDRMPFKVGGRPHHGVSFLEYHPVADSQWAQGLVEPLVGPQVQRNRARSQTIEMKDRAGLGRAYAVKGSISAVTRPKGGVFELVEVLPGHELPKETQGVGPGPWLSDEVAQNDQDMERIAGIREVSLGGAPQGVSAYAAFALLAEQDNQRVGPVISKIRTEIAELVKVHISGIRRYWSQERTIDVPGDDPDGLLDSFVFAGAKLPETVYVKIGMGAPVPKHQAAETQLIFDLFDRALSTGQPLPIDWLYESIREGRALPLPKREHQVQLDNIELENMLLIRGAQITPRPTDNDELHVAGHGELIMQLSMVPGAEGIVQAAEMHRQLHLLQAQQKQAQAISLAGTNPGGSLPSPQQGNGRDAGLGPLAAMGAAGPGGQAPIDPSVLLGQ